MKRLIYLNKTSFEDFSIDSIYSYNVKKRRILWNLPTKKKLEKTANDKKESVTFTDKWTAIKIEFSNQ